MSPSDVRLLEALAGALLMAGLDRVADAILSAASVECSSPPPAVPMLTLVHSAS